MTNKEENRIVELPGQLYTRIADRLKETGFTSVDEYVVFVLEEVLNEEAEGGEEIPLSQEEEEEVKKRLKSLGYLH